MEKRAPHEEKFSIFSCGTSGRALRCVPGDERDGSGLSKARFMEKVRQSNEACRRGDFQSAVSLYTDALQADPQNCILYSNRSAALLKLGRHRAALDDAGKACRLNPKWPKAYFRQGVALQYLGRHADALAAFASGLAQDPKSLQLLVGMVEAAMKSPLRESLEPTYQQLQKMKLDKSPFVVVSVIGQELLTASHHTASVVVLEAALKIGTCSLKLRGSVFSALSSAHWSLGNAEKSTGYMQQDLEVAKTLGDQSGECRAHGNLGSAFFSKGNYREALTNHRNQLVLAMKLKDRESPPNYRCDSPPKDLKASIEKATGHSGRKKTSFRQKPGQTNTGPEPRPRPRPAQTRPAQAQTQIQAQTGPVQTRPRPSQNHSWKDLTIKSGGNMKDNIGHHEDLTNDT
ncbi:tetratricopeptide repeat protein 28 [Etheostoma spectabile]|uniref:tetratricopeptide repeat protein 28 n=1 Tax=Etheostoma spectabile TaxID=54343 RepID=UPI0013AEF57F|nr:tetratricopeptide repeat protein 28-like [Etheostoma spectabile]